MFFFKVGEKSQKRERVSISKGVELVKEQVGGDRTRRTERASFRLRWRNWMHLSSQEARKEFEEFLSRGPCFLHKYNTNYFLRIRREGSIRSLEQERVQTRFAGQGQGPAEGEVQVHNRPHAARDS